MADIIAPRIFADFYVSNDGEGGVCLETLLADDKLDKRIFRHVCRLNVRAWCHNWFGSDTGRMVATQLLPFMPNLEAFRWDQGFIPAETVAALHAHCPKLTELSIEYQHAAEVFQSDDEVLSQSLFAYQLPDFTVFRNLRSLTLRYFDGTCMWPWREQLAKLCQNNSRTLRYLHLSTPESLGSASGEDDVSRLPRSMTRVFAQEAAARPDPHDQRSWHSVFFSSLFHTYAEAGAAPLQLDFLNLGLASWRFTRDALCKFVDLQCLKEVVLGGKTTHAFESEQDAMPFSYLATAAYRVHREGGNVLPAVARIQNAMTKNGVALFALNPCSCPNLRGISVFHTSPTIHHLLAAASWVNMDWLRQLAVISHMHHPFWTLASRPYDYLPPLLLLLPGLNVQQTFSLPGPVHLRMMNSPYDPYSTFRRSRLLRDQTGVIRHASDPAPGIWQVPEPDPTPDMTFDQLVSADDGTLQGLHVRIKMLFPGCPLSPRIAHVIGPQLGRLQNLSQLMIKLDTQPAPGIDELAMDEGAIIADLHGEIGVNSYMKKLVEGYGNDADIVLPFVKHSRSLQYVKMTETAWRVLRNDAGDVSGLKMLDTDEDAAVELFRLRERCRGCDDG